MPTPTPKTKSLISRTSTGRRIKKRIDYVMRVYNRAMNRQKFVNILKIIGS